MSTIGERLATLETKIEELERIITEVRDLLKSQVINLTNKDIHLEERVRILEINSVQLNGKKGWFIAGAVLVLIVLLGLNILDESDLIKVSTFLK